MWNSENGIAALRRKEKSKTEFFAGKKLVLLKTEILLSRNNVTENISGVLWSHWSVEDFRP